MQMKNTRMLLETLTIFLCDTVDVRVGPRSLYCESSHPKSVFNVFVQVCQLQRQG